MTEMGVKKAREELMEAVALAGEYSPDGEGGREDRLVQAFEKLAGVVLKLLEEVRT